MSDQALRVARIADRLPAGGVTLLVIDKSGAQWTITEAKLGRRWELERT